MPRQKYNSVDELMKELDHPLKDVVELLRNVVIKAHKNIQEQVKWNSPSYFYTGDDTHLSSKKYEKDIVVFNLNKADYILMIFPTGYKINHAILEGSFDDGRRMITIYGLSDLIAKQANIQMAIQEWIACVEP